MFLAWPCCSWSCLKRPTCFSKPRVCWVRLKCIGCKERHFFPPSDRPDPVSAPFSEKMDEEMVRFSQFLKLSVFWTILNAKRPGANVPCLGRVRIRRSALIGFSMLLKSGNTENADSLSQVVNIRFFPSACWRFPMKLSQSQGSLHVIGLLAQLRQPAITKETYKGYELCKCVK